MLQTADGRIKKWQHFDCAKTLAHMLQKYQAMGKFRDVMQKQVDFLDSRMEPGMIVAVMHTVALMLNQIIGKFYTKAEIGILLVEAMKFCVPFSNRKAEVDGADRLWLFFRTRHLKPWRRCDRY